MNNDTNSDNDIGQSAPTKDESMNNLSALTTPATINSNNNITSIDTNKSSWDDDVFRVRTIEECESIFSEYCEQRLEALKQIKNQAGKLSVLRSCCELLTRLENTVHISFAGRVLIFLAKYLPYFDRSGLNLKNEIACNELPRTVKESLKQADEKNAAKLKTISLATGQDIEEGETLSDDEDQLEDGATPTSSQTQTPSLNDPEKLYEKFWRIQTILHQPELLYDKTNWFSFRAMVDILILHFEQTPVQFKIWNMDGSYMTRPKTLSLQINDINMRRCVLLEIFFTLDLLSSRLETRPETLRLDSLQMKWLSTSYVRILELLGSMPNKREGHQFSVFIRQILKEEVMWSRWKAEKCPEAKPVAKEDDEFVAMGSTYHKRRKVSNELKMAKPYNMQVIGGPDMSQLWNRRAQQTNNLPDVAKYFNQPSEKRLESFKDPQTSFRILRLLRKSPHFFVPAASMIQSLEGYLKALAEKHFNGNNVLL